MNAVDTFMSVANATAAIVERAPAYVTYRVHETVRAAGTGEFDRTVTVRSVDGVAIVKNDTTGKDEVRSPFPAPPTFDALAKFKLTGQITIGGGHGKEAPILRRAPMRSRAALRAIPWYSPTTRRPRSGICI